MPPKGKLAAAASPNNEASAVSFSAPARGWPSDGWWYSLGDAQLDQLVIEGLGGATDLRVAEARFAQARAQMLEVRSHMLPSASAGGRGGATKQSYNYLVPEDFSPRGWQDYGQTSLDLDWQIDFWGRNRAALSAAKSDAAAAEAEAAAARLAVSAGIVIAYVDLAGLEAEREAARQAADVRLKTLDLMSERMVRGLENDGAVQRARSARAVAQQELAALDESLALTRVRIAALIGAGPDRGLAIGKTATSIVAPWGLPTDLPAELVGRRPDIIAARLRSEAAASRIKAARADFYPNVNLAGLVGLQALGIGNVFKSGSTFGTTGPAITLPIFDGGRLRGRYRAAEADYEAAVAQYDGALVQALSEVAGAVTSLRALDVQLDRAHEAERSAVAAWTVAGNRYRGGLATYLDLLTAEDALIASRRNLSSLQNRGFALDVSLIRALGGGFRS